MLLRAGEQVAARAGYLQSARLMSSTRPMAARPDVTAGVRFTAYDLLRVLREW